MNTTNTSKDSKSENEVVKIKFFRLPFDKKAKLFSFLKRNRKELHNSHTKEGLRVICANYLNLPELTIGSMDDIRRKAKISVIPDISGKSKVLAKAPSAATLITSAKINKSSKVLSVSGNQKSLSKNTQISQLKELVEQSKKVMEISRSNLDREANKMKKVLDILNKL